ncbi:DMT family transporter [Ramlibacter algicola]|uniref:DMT family transporter n=1 Tax=Ramlibacter algicola TaxID=2795217 RepID=A0A934Q048_9BURK|nr:DMT family transporter [Ramlibacter algicola]MBK0392268.1 DMT family transporter [Ramlibacter algicola]
MTGRARGPRAWVVDFLLLAAIWGGSFLFIRLGVVEFGPLATAFMRVAIASAFLLPLVAWKGRAGDLVAHWKSIFAIGVFNSALPFALYSFALTSIATGLSAILNATVPLFGALVAWGWLRERPAPWRAAGLAIGFAGVALLAGDKADFHSRGQALPTGWAVLLCLFATLSYGVAASAAKKYLSGRPALVTAAGSQLGALVALAPFAWWSWPAALPGLRAWLALVALGVLCTGVAYILYFRLIEEAGPSRALAVTFVVPVFAVLYGVLFLDEAVTGWMLFCAAIIVAGTALSTGLVQPRASAAARRNA